jgi:hypothetical protein
MTIQEICALTGLSSGKAKNWIESGLLELSEPAADQIVERVHLIRALQDKGIPLGQLAGKNLAFRSGERFIIFDGRQLYPCSNAETAIGFVTRSRRPCAAVDLGAIRRSASAT